ncbi:hypothetical protein KR222_009771 [Zaprionus bogoriensis]|nr:hypothetical protein KR222_009771 [Zaprionus bogoriensis]
MNWSYKEFVCGAVDCGRTFNTRWTLKRHSAIHRQADNPIFTCNKCDKTFSRKDSLDRHYQMCHSSVVMMYMCSEDGCGKFFSMRSTLYRHMTSHTGCYECSQCARSFARKDNLARHKT